MKNISSLAKMMLTKMQNLNKKGMELPINFIIILIISLAVFTGGIYFVNKLFGEAENIQLSMDSNLEAQTENMLMAGQQVAVPLSQKTIKNGEVAVFSLGILNTKDSALEFETAVECFVYSYNGKDEDCPKKDYGVQQVNAVTLEKNARRVIPVGIVIPKGAKGGTYGYSITVTADGEPYGGAAKTIYVNLV